MKYEDVADSPEMEYWRLRLKENENSLGFLFGYLH